MQTVSCLRVGAAPAAQVYDVYSSFPISSMALEMNLYVERGVRPGAALMALLCGDVQGAMSLGGEFVCTHVGAIVGWMYDNLPVAAQGSRAIVDRWLGMFDGSAPIVSVPTFVDRPVVPVASEARKVAA